MDLSLLGVLAAIVAIAAIVWVRLQRRPDHPWARWAEQAALYQTLAAFDGIPIITSCQVKPGTMYVMSPAALWTDSIDVRQEPRFDIRDELRMGMLVVRPSDFIKITNV